MHSTSTATSATGGDEDDLWFLPGPPEDDFAMPPGVGRSLPAEATLVAEWAQAEAGYAVRLARVAMRLGALDERLRQGPEGWRQRLALLEAADLSWIIGDRVAADRVALWVALRLSGVQSDAAALARVGWAIRRLSAGPGPLADGIGGFAAFLGRHDPADVADPAERFADRAAGWLGMMADAGDLHPVSRACLGHHLWLLTGQGQPGDQCEAAVLAARVAATEAGAMVFAPLCLGGALGLRATGTPPERLARWLDGMESATMSAMRHLDRVEDWSNRATQAMRKLSGRTPARLRAVLADWPLVSAPMAEALTGASRAAVQRNLAWMESQGLVHEVTGQGRFRMWRAT